MKTCTLSNLTLCLLLSVYAYSIPLETSVNIHERSVPSSASTGERRVIAEGHTIELECNAYGTSPPVIHWLKNGEFLPQGPLDNVARNVIAPPSPTPYAVGEEEGYEYDTVSTLLIHDASPQDSAKYTCVADLPEERRSKHFEVVVAPSEDQHGQPSKRSDTSDEDARIYLYTDKAFGLEGPSSLFICRATQGLTKAPPTIQWSINGEPITDNKPGFKIHSNGDLMVTHTTSAFHMAAIKCMATGDNGSTDEKSPFIYLYEPEE